MVGTVQGNLWDIKSIDYTKGNEENGKFYFGQLILMLYSLRDTNLSIVLELHNGAALVFQDQSLGLSVGELQHEREVPIDVVVSQYVAAVAREGHVAAVECEEVLAVDDNSADCRRKKRLGRLSFG